MDCVKVEEAHPDYPAAKAREQEEFRRGNRNYEGVGAPSDLRFLSRAARYLREQEAVEAARQKLDENRYIGPPLSDAEN